jgi:regulator of replication initiation timing
MDENERLTEMRKRIKELEDENVALSVELEKNKRCLSRLRLERE